MKTLIILTHPAVESFNHFIAASARSAADSLGEVDFLDLYRTRFQPVLIQEEILQHTSLDPLIQILSQRVEAADLLIFVYPEWWGGPPALLKGFLDRIFRPGTAYEMVGDEVVGREQRGLFQNKAALVFSTTDADKPQVFHPAEAVWATSVFPYCGIRRFSFHTFFATRTSDFEDRQEWLAQVRRLTQDFVERHNLQK